MISRRKDIAPVVDCSAPPRNCFHSPKWKHASTHSRRLFPPTAISTSTLKVFKSCYIAAPLPSSGPRVTHNYLREIKAARAFPPPRYIPKSKLKCFKTHLARIERHVSPESVLLLPELLPRSHTAESFIDCLSRGIVRRRVYSA